MARTIWKGSINFGLVTIPVALYPAEQQDTLDFTLLDERDKSPVGYRRVNKKTGVEVPFERIVKGYEYDKDRYVILGDEELRRANIKATQSIEIEDFVQIEQIPFMYFYRPYYLEPIKKLGEKGYALLRDTLRRSGRVGIARVVLKTRQHLAMLAPVGELLILNLLRYQYELRKPTEIEVPGELHSARKELDMAQRLVENMTTKWNPAKYHDDYRDDVMKLVKRKIAAGKTLEIEEAPAEGGTRESAQVIDFMTLLKRSVEQKEKTKPTTAGSRRRKPVAAPRRVRKHA